ncbi:MAG: hypothetical protein ACI3XC_03545 [Phascolarctobacterium sp.]
MQEAYGHCASPLKEGAQRVQKLWFLFFKKGQANYSSLLEGGGTALAVTEGDL